MSFGGNSSTNDRDLSEVDTMYTNGSTSTTAAVINIA